LIEANTRVLKPGTAVYWTAQYGTGAIRPYQLYGRTVYGRLPYTVRFHALGLIMGMATPSESRGAQEALGPEGVPHVPPTASTWPSPIPELMPGSEETYGRRTFYCQSLTKTSNVSNLFRHSCFLQLEVFLGSFLYKNATEPHGT
jgi:hypothetical protein